MRFVNLSSQYTARRRRNRVPTFHATAGKRENRFYYPGRRADHGKKLWDRLYSVFF